MPVLVEVNQRKMIAVMMRRESKRRRIKRIKKIKKKKRKNKKMKL